MVTEQNKKYIRRSIEPILDYRMQKHKMAMIRGPRGVGKTTVAKQWGGTWINLADPDVHAEFMTSPAKALKRYEPPFVIDEWQLIPNILWVAKDWVDQTHQRGQILLVGSVSGMYVNSVWPLGGRAVFLDMFSLTQSEIQATNTIPLVDRLIAGIDLRFGLSPVTKREYLKMAMVGGFPETHILGVEDRWPQFKAYIQLVNSRVTLGKEHVPSRSTPTLDRFLRACSAYSGKIGAASDINKLAHVSKKTGEKHLGLLKGLMIVEDIPGWYDSSIQKLHRRPKLFLTDSGLHSYLENTHEYSIDHDPTSLGPLLETFVAAQIRAEMTFAKSHYQMFHLRRNSGDREIDLLLETNKGDLIAIEITWEENPSPDKAKHMKWLRKNVGKRLVAGVVLHTGDECGEIDDRIFTAPISTLWADNTGIEVWTMPS